MTQKCVLEMSSCCFELTSRRPCSEPNKLKLEKSGVGQELAIDVLRMKWPNVSGDDPPKSVCSEPCPMGHVRSYAVSSLRHI